MTDRELLEQIKTLIETTVDDSEEPPEEWRDVTKECAAWPWCAHGKTHDRVFYVSHEEDLVGEQAGYRLRKVQLYKQAPSLLEQWAFVVEEKVQP